MFVSTLILQIEGQVSLPAYPTRQVNRREQPRGWSSDMSTSVIRLGGGIPIQARVTCPHCWSEFSPDQILWIAEHPDLVGDPRLGADSLHRFLPSRFNLQGAAVDARNFACHALACPRCHLSVPRPLLEMAPVFLSILGAPACGKSYFLAAMSWRLRKLLPQRFSLSFNDADSVLNHVLHEYESVQFLNPNQDELVAIRKTEAQGDLYDTVLFGDQRVSYPRPFVFSVFPLEGHPNYGAAATAARVLCVYDNAGESFLPGADTAASPVTRHLALSRALMFLFDPTQDMRFRKLCSGKTNDPQMMERSERLDRERPVRQETILAEAAQRVRRFSGLGENQKHPRPLIVVVTKLDTWAPLLQALRIRELNFPWECTGHGPVAAMQLDVVDALSQKLRSLLWEVSPELVAAAESFASQVLYVPVSATGSSPERDPRTGAFGFRPKNIKPVWAEVPLLYTMSRWMQGLVPYRRGSAGSDGRNAGRGRSSWADRPETPVGPPR
jgi:hypothetical protein